MRSYIELNNDLRQKSRNEFEKTLYKLMNNSVFGKTMENVRRYRDVRLCTSWYGRNGARKMISKPNFHSCIILQKDLVIVEKKRLNVTFNKPIYVGFSVLDISKTFLYDFHYNYIKKTFGNLSRLMYCDTDALVYHIFTEDIYQIIKRDHEKFDTSDYDPDNPFEIELLNKKVMGLMKDELCGNIITEFIALRSKMYAYRVYYLKKQQICDTLKAKGITESSLKTLSFEHYYDSLFNKSEHFICQKTIKSHNHQVYSMSQKKLGLSPFDDKRVVNYISNFTVPWGYHCNITK